MEDWEESYSENQILLIHGGESGGHLAHHQHLRMQIFERFPHKPITRLPESIYFSDKANLRATAAMVRMQSSFTLFVRGPKSFEFAGRVFECVDSL
jgi:exopolysaccharide biosynthesis predicted pyruvyltransferase EpsI